MKPRDLRHLLEKSAKVLVIIQKHVPDVACMIDETKGDNGQLVVDFEGSGENRKKMFQLGKDLENKGYDFIENKSPWLGKTTYKGRAQDKPTVILSIPINKDRLVINDVSPEKAFSFADA